MCTGYTVKQNPFSALKELMVLKGWLVTSLVAQLVKNPPAMWETPVRFLGGEDPLEKAKATHSSILAWILPLYKCKGFDLGQT